MRVIDVGPWRGPSKEDWVTRINDGAQRILEPQARQKWARPWIVYVGRTSPFRCELDSY